MQPREPTAAEQWQDRQFRIAWLKTLIASYESEHDWANDEDAGATHEMLAACRAIHARLLKDLGPCPADPQAEAAKQHNDAIPF